MNDVKTKRSFFRDRTKDLYFVSLLFTRKFFMYRGRGFRSE